MSPLTTAHAELLLAVKKADERAAQARAQLQRTFSPAAQAAELHDHRVAATGDMATALDLIEPGLGERWMQAMYPEVQLSEVPR
ncbi:MAG: hypothetical protein RL375_3403 [Pseudomonadota bacterium]|jgi:hypothetical protein